MRDRWVSTIAKLIGKKLPTLPNYGNPSKNSARKPVENQIRNLTEQELIAKHLTIEDEDGCDMTKSSGASVLANKVPMIEV